MTTLLPMTIVVGCYDGSTVELKLDSSKRYPQDEAEACDRRCYMSKAQNFLDDVRLNTVGEFINLETLDLVFRVNDCLLEYIESNRQLIGGKRPAEVESITTPTGETGFAAQLWVAFELKRFSYWSV